VKVKRNNAHIFLYTGTPSATGLSGRLYRCRHFHKPVFSYLSRLTMGHCSNLSAASAAIDQYLLLVAPTAANLQHWVCCCGPMLGQTDGWTRNHFIDPALHTMWTVPINNNDVNYEKCFTDITSSCFSKHHQLKTGGFYRMSNILLPACP